MFGFLSCCMQGWFLDRQAVVLRLRETMRARSASVDAGTAGEQSAREARASLTRAAGSLVTFIERGFCIRFGSHSHKAAKIISNRRFAFW